MHRWIDRNAPYLICLSLALAWAPATGCLPGGEEGECSSTQPCSERGTECNLSTRVCEEIPVDVDSLDPDFSGGNFGPLALPFFRGRVCMPDEVATGDEVPIKIDPCVHPCVTPTTFHFSQKYNCNDADCEIILAQWFMASGADCPADALERFDKSMCSYPLTVAAHVGPIDVNGTPISGEMEVELPFMNLDDASEWADNVNSERAFELAHQYPIDPNRRLPLSLQPGHPSAPDNCDDESLCNCVEVGF
ncbi:MAG: hypothetical protein H6713_09600 [Myxococcales bacterium]|nr:hypothetical protein [Myxococcales bacterium]MCB9750243.1 hypothetical protein [Myxococcales bacterium]